MEKYVVTVEGKDSVGIIAKVCSYLAEAGINILDVTQSADEGWFSMTSVVDMEHAGKDAASVSRELHSLGEKIGLDIQCRKEEK